MKIKNIAHSPAIDDAASRQEKNRQMKLNRFLSEKNRLIPILCVLGILIFLAANYIINLAFALIGNFGAMIGGHAQQHSYGLILAVSFNHLPWYLYIVLIMIIATLLVRQAYKIRTAFKSYNVGQKGSMRWTTLKEIQEQYKAVPKSGETYPGKPGVPISQYKNSIYIDDSAVNNLIIGITRSGKGEMYVFPAIDVLSRTEKMEDRPSIIATDPKLELAASSYMTLINRGYEVHILNLIDPMESMGFNPLTKILDAYKAGDYATAELLCSSFCYSIFNPGATSGDSQFWSNNSTNALSALILAHIDDCLTQDARENTEARTVLEMRKQRFLALSDEEKAIVIENWEIPFGELYRADNPKDYETSESEQYSENKKFEAWQQLPERIRSYISATDSNADATYSHLFAQPGETFEESHEHEKAVNMYSIINTFSFLARENLDEKTTALDLYFRNRPSLDRAAMKYSAIEVAGDKTKGSIFSNTLSQLTVFTYENIAKMTAESTVNLEDIGFGKKPVAVFIGMPDYDRSNFFIASVFIRQVYFSLAKKATMTRSGKCTRQVHFMLDEFGNIPAIENMATIATVCLGRNIRFNLIIQAYAQLESVYGKADSNTIAGNCANQIYIMTNDEETAEKYSKLIGSETITDVSIAGSKLSLDKQITESYNARALLDSNELMSLKEGQCVVKRVIHRQDLAHNKVTPYPIFNTGDMEISYRYQYLLKDFPSSFVLADYVKSGNPINEEISDEQIQAELQHIRSSHPLETIAHINLNERVFDVEDCFNRMPQIIDRKEKRYKRQFSEFLNLQKEGRTVEEPAPFVPPEPQYVLTMTPLKKLLASSMTSNIYIVQHITDVLAAHGIIGDFSNATFFDILRDARTKPFESELYEIFGKELIAP